MSVTSVGSLYQYFATKDALVIALAERKMDTVMVAMQTALAETEGQPLAPRVRRLIEDLLRTKARQAELGAAIAITMAEIEGYDYAARVTDSACILLRDLFDAHRDEVHVSDPALSAYLVAHAVEGIVSNLVVAPPCSLRDPRLVNQMVCLVMGYLGGA